MIQAYFFGGPEHGKYHTLRRPEQFMIVQTVDQTPCYKKSYDDLVEPIPVTNHVYMPLIGLDCVYAYQIGHKA